MRLPARKQIGVRTVFNLLGPLTNPAGARSQVMGVFSADAVDLVAETLAELDVERALVVHGAGGLDEISLAGETQSRTYKRHSETVLRDAGGFWRGASAAGGHSRRRTRGECDHASSYLRGRDGGPARHGGGECSGGAGGGKDSAVIARRRRNCRNSVGIRGGRKQIGRVAGVYECGAGVKAPDLASGAG